MLQVFNRMKQKLKPNEIVNTFEKINYDVSYKILDKTISFWSTTI